MWMAFWSSTFFMSSGKRIVFTDEVAHYGYAVRGKGGFYGRGGTLWLCHPEKGRFVRTRWHIMVMPSGKRVVCTDEVAHYGYTVRKKGGFYGWDRKYLSQTEN